MVDDSFDPYYTSLGIPPEEQPPNYYRLLGLSLFLAPEFGLTHPDSVSNLTRRAARAMAKSPALCRQVDALQCKLQAATTSD